MRNNNWVVEMDAKFEIRVEPSPIEHFTVAQSNTYELHMNFVRIISYSQVFVTKAQALNIDTILSLRLEAARRQ